MRMENINSIFFLSQGIQIVREKVGTILMIQNHSFSEINEHDVIFKKHNSMFQISAEEGPGRRHFTGQRWQNLGLH